MTQITDPTPGLFSFRSMFAVGALELQRAELNPTVMLHVDAATERPRFSCGKIENNDVTALAFLRSLTRSMTSQWDHPPTPHRPQIATVSECRYRWLRAPATKHQQKPPARNAGGSCVEARRSRPSQPALSCRPFASKRPAEKCKSRGQASQAPEIINDVALYRTLRSGNPISTIVALIRLFSVRNAGLAFSIGRSTLAVVEFGRNANPCAIAAFASSCRPSRS